MRTLLPGAITESSSPTPMGISSSAVRNAASCAASRQSASISSAAAVIIAVM